MNFERLNILLTGGAGFIGSNLAEALLRDPRVQRVRVFDNLSTGRRENLRELQGDPRLEFIQGDIRDYAALLDACHGIDCISHQAALGSVPRSIADPLTSHGVNADGTLNVFWAARESGITRVVYASSSSVYGDSPELPKREDRTGKPLSPYAVTKAINELYAGVWGPLYGMELIGLRYFNIFGPKQSPDGPYAAVIPLFCRAIREQASPLMHGDGRQSRDFTYVSNAVQANILALFTENPEAVNQTYNVACGEEMDLLTLYTVLCDLAGGGAPPAFGPPRPGDVRHSLADIGKAARLLGYAPEVRIPEGLQKTLEWFF